LKKGSIKNERVSRDLAQKLAVIIQRDVHDPRVPSFTSIVKAEVAPDLKSCRVYVSVLGDSSKLESAVCGLRSAEPYLRTKLAKAMQLKNTPELRFIADDSLAYADKMNTLISEL